MAYLFKCLIKVKKIVNDLSFPLAVCIAQRLVRPSKQLKQMKQIIQTEQLSIPIARRQTSRLFKSVAKDFNSARVP